MDVRFADAKKLTDEDVELDINELSTLPYHNESSDVQIQIPEPAQTEFNPDMVATQQQSIMQNQILRNTHERITAQENPYARTQAPVPCAQSNRVLRPVSGVSNTIDADDLGHIGVGDRRVRRENTGVYRMQSSQGFSSTRSGNFTQPKK